MAKAGSGRTVVDGRNGPCRCGSGRKVKRCCGTRRGPGPRDLARAFLVEQGRLAVGLFGRFRRSEFDELFEQLVDLPATDVSLQLRLPRVLSPELEELRLAMYDDEDDDDDDGYVAGLVAAALRQLDTPERRAEVARAVLARRDGGRIDPRLAGVAMIDLNVGSSALFKSSLLQALAVSAGAARTPSGLIVAAR